MPDFSFSSPGGFDTNFAVEPVPGYLPTAAEAAWLVEVGACIRALCDPKPRNGVAQSERLRRLKEGVRDRGMRVLRGRVEAVVALPAGPVRDQAATAAIPECYRLEGRYREWLSRIEHIPFTVVPVERGNKSPLFCDIRIDTRDVTIPDAVGALKTEIDNALTVTKTVFAERESGVPWVWKLLGLREQKVRDVQVRLHEYISQLVGIATVGLMNTDPTQAPFARLDLQRYKAEFTMREAGAVKNHYVRRLGNWCFLMAVVFTLLYVYARAQPAHTIPRDFRNFLLLGAGAMCGTWLSFLLRRGVLTFNDLAVLEEDRLNPGIRVLFMVGLSAVAGLLFWSEAVVFVLGNFHSAPALYDHGAYSLLLGLLAGIAERALGTAVAKRANDLPAAIAAAGAPARAH